MSPIKAHRDQLYREIWTEPVRTVARRYGVSNVALAKICRNLDVPRPPLGYWTRKKHGYTTEQAPLPPLRRGADVAVTISSPPRLSGEMQARLAEPGEGQIAVKVRLLHPHPLVAATAKVLKASKGTASSPRWDGAEVTPGHSGDSEER